MYHYVQDGGWLWGSYLFVWAGACVLSRFSHFWLGATLWTAACQASLSTGFSRQEYWSGCPCPSPGHIPNPGVKPMSLSSSALAAAAAAKSLQLCPTLCDPIDGSPPGFPAPGILQARTLDWVAISFSNAWKWKLKVKSFSCVQLFTTPWTAAYQAPPSMGFSRQEYWSGVPSPSPFPNLAAVNRYFNAITLSETIIVTLTELYLFK